MLLYLLFFKLIRHTRQVRYSHPAVVHSCQQRLSQLGRDLHGLRCHYSLWMLMGNTNQHRMFQSHCNYTLYIYFFLKNYDITTEFFQATGAWKVIPLPGLTLQDSIDSFDSALQSPGPKDPKHRKHPVPRLASETSQLARLTH